MDFAAFVLLPGYVLNFSFIVYILFFERNDSARRFSWLLAIAFLPLAGVILYILLSGNFFTRTKRMVKATTYANTYYNRILENQTKHLKELIEEGTHQDIDSYGPLIHLNLVYGKSPVMGPNTVHVFTSGEAKYESLFSEILSAKETVHLSYFIINNDNTGKELIRILSIKAREGVRVRLLYDHVGSILTSHTLFKPLKKAGGMVHRFFPVSLINPFSINYRNHRKIAVIDGKIGYFGGMNIGDEYANKSKRRRFYWRDTHVRIVGPAVHLLQKQFLVDWYTTTENETTFEDGSDFGQLFPEIRSDIPAYGISADLARDTIRDVPVQIVGAGPDSYKDDEIRDALIHMISHAKKSVYIETPYFTPDQAFFAALKIAALSAIDVRIIIPRDWDKWYVRLAAMPYVEDLLSCGVRFWRYNGFMHAKMFVIDGILSTIGSTNIDTRSFSLHFELNAFFYSAEAGRVCEQIFLRDLDNSTVFEKDFFMKAMFLRRGVWNFFKLFAPLM